MLPEFKKGYCFLVPVTWFMLCAPMDADSGQMARADFHVLTSDGFQIAVREVKLAASGTKKNPPVIWIARKGGGLR